MNVYNSRKYKGMYGKYRKAYIPDKRSNMNDEKDEKKANTQ